MATKAPVRPAVAERAAGLERWFTALDEARSGERIANVVWFGDSISELDPGFLPLPWFVGRVLSGWTEEVQYRNAGAEFTPAMQTTGKLSADDDAGFGGRSVELEPGESCTFEAVGVGVTINWTRRPGGGVLEVGWGHDHLGTIETDGTLAHTQQTEYRRGAGHVAESVTVTARGARATLEGIYLHGRNIDHGVRVWPAVRSGNTTQDFLDHPGWGLEAVQTLGPDLVVIATGTNVATSYDVELASLIDAVRARTDADVAVWVPYLNSSFTLEEAEAGRAVAADKGCALVDAAAALGVPPTVDGAHPDTVGTALAGSHASASLSGDPVSTIAMMAGQLAASHGGRHEWRPGGGSISIESPLGSSVLAGRGLADEPGQQWALLLEGLASGLFGLPGATVSLGPGGKLPIDTHMSRVGTGRLSLNAGSGQLDLARLLVTGGDEPDVEEGGAVLYARPRGEQIELAVRLPDGTGHVLAPTPRSGFRPPVPCALAPAHRPAVGGHELRSGRVIWLPFPALERAVVATHVWVEVLGGRPGARASAAIVAALADGRPGDVVQVTGPDAIDLSVVDMAGAALQAPTRIEPGEPWWVAILSSSGDERPVVGAAEALEGLPVVQLGTAPVAPAAGLVTGALSMDGQTCVPERPSAGLGREASPIPVMHVSLQAP